MSNTLTYKGVTFNDSKIIAANITETKSPLTDTLSYDELYVEVLNESGPSKFLDSASRQIITADNKTFYAYGGDPVDLRVFTRGASGEVSHSSQFLGKYYIESVDRISKNVYGLHFVSALGILDRKVFTGGIYTRVTAGSIINAIMGGTYSSEDTDYEYYTGDIPYAIQKTLKAVLVTGWMPYSSSSRDSLQQLLFAVGGSVLKTSNGTMLFAFWQPTEATTISDDRLYQGGSTEYISKATKVIVTEHDFRSTSLDIQTELYNSDNITVSNKLVLFDKPCHTLAVTGTLTIDSYGANYAYVSGNGTLTGYEYTHATTTIEKDTGVEGDENVVSVTDAYLVSSLNSYNVCERVAAYYSAANIVKYDVVQNGDIKVGDRVRFTDPFGDDVTGYLSTQELTLSNTLKGSMEFITNWLPNHTGNQYNHYTILSSGSSWAVPSALQGTPARVVIFGGFEGGDGGENGADGGSAYWSYYTGVGGAGGEGGDGGDGGTTVNINTIDITSLASTYAYTLGTGGAGGAIGSAGSLGTDSTFNGVSSSAGETNTTGWANPIDGTIYGGQADNGKDGGDGGKGGNVAFIDGGTSWNDGADGESVGTGIGGDGGAKIDRTVDGDGHYVAGGGGGGGASSDSSGTDGGSGLPSTSIGFNPIGGSGGNGASVTATLSQASLGHCGIGGDGGGGGGGAGNCGKRTGSSTYVKYSGGTAGTGGNGQAGQQGSNGFILIMHQ